jgi:hypothetical protein
MDRFNHSWLCNLRRDMKELFTWILLIITYSCACGFLISGSLTHGRIPQIIGLLLIIIGNQFFGLLKSK